MRSFLPEAVAVFLSSFFAIAAVYLKLPVSQLQQIVIVLMLILLFFFNKLLNNRDYRVSKVYRLSLLFLISLFVQIWVVSTGGLRSPFLILIHLLSLGTAFLVNLGASITFLLFSIGVILASALLSPEARDYLQHDIGTSLLYLTSFIVIIPLSVLVSKYYYVKDALLNVLKKELALKDIQSETVLKGISEIVFVVNKNLQIVYASETAERELTFSRSEMINKPLLDVIFLKDIVGRLVVLKDLPFAQIFEDKTTRITKGLLLFVKNRAVPRKVSLQIRPIINLEGKVDQLTVVISGNKETLQNTEVKHRGIEEALLKNQALFEGLKDELTSRKMDSLKFQLDAARHSTQDIISLMELENHGIRTNLKLIDVAQVSKKSLEEESDFAKALKVELGFAFADFGVSDITPLVPKGFNITPDQLTAPFFTIPIDVKWTDLLIKKLLEVSILLSSGAGSKTVKLLLNKGDKSSLRIDIISSHHMLDAADLQTIFQPNYGSLVSKTNLYLGSGLEGYLAKSITEVLRVPLTVEQRKESSQIIFSLNFSKMPFKD